MHTTTAPAATAAVSSARRGTRRGPIRLVIAGSLLTGAVLSAVLPLVVFGAGSEAVVTGSALLGFAAGWAMLAALTSRRTTQPQRWAWVPAAALGATGVAVGAVVVIVRPLDGVR